MKHNTLFSMTLLVVLFMLAFGSSSWIMGCTGIFFANNKTALAGNNEDWMSPFSRIWFIPAQGKKFGRVCFGFQEGGTQGAMNDQGLFFDGFALNPLEAKPVAGKEIYPGDLAQKAIEECRTVDEVIALFERYDRQGLAASQMFVADKEGNSAIIEAEAIIRKQGDHQIVTNFRQSCVAPDAITDSRYLIVRKMMEAKDKVDVDLFRRMLAAAHQEGKYPTQYTNICDLKTGIIHLYRFHNYEQVVRIDLRRELSKGRRVIDLQSLFPESHAADFYKKEIEKTMAERLSKHQIVPLKPELANSLIGEYGFGSGMLAGYTITISMQENTLFAEVSSLLEKSQLHPLSDSEYVISGMEEIYSLKFVGAAADGKMKLKISMMGIEAEASRN
jgi:hypothetical protein